MIRRIIHADNNCLFNAILYATSAFKIPTNSIGAMELRKVVRNEIESEYEI